MVIGRQVTLKNAQAEYQPLIDVKDLPAWPSVPDYEQLVEGRELAANPKAALAFHWKSLDRQIRIRGLVSVVSDEEADAYFASRHRSSQLGAWASQQSRPLESRFAFEKAIALATARYPLGTVPRPPYWIGYRVMPLAIEFWHERAFRLHDRIVFTRAAPCEA